MSYTGSVSPGGPPDVRRLDSLTIAKLAVDRRMSNNCYLLTCTTTGRRLLVDAAAEPERLLVLLEEPESPGWDATRALDSVVTTHQHWDHHRALAAVVDATGAAVLVGAPDAPAVTDQTGVPVTRELHHGDIVTVGAASLEVIALRGHTPGSVALLYDDRSRPGGIPHLFTGDSLFPGGPGKTDGSAEFTSLMSDLERRVFDRLPDQTWFYPGHGDDSTLGAERPKLGEWRARGW